MGIDPGTRAVGYGLVESRGSRLSLVRAGVIRPPAKDPLERRLARIVRDLRELLLAERPDAAAVEDAFVNADPRAALAVGCARGAILAALGEAEVAVTSYPPATIKRAVAGNGRAAKPQVGRMAARILGVEAPPEADATDALAAALTHALRSRLQLPRGA